MERRYPQGLTRAWHRVYAREVHNHSDGTALSQLCRTPRPSPIWAEGSGTRSAHPGPTLLAERFIHLSGLSVHTLPTPQAIYYSFCFLCISLAWGLSGVCDFHASTHTCTRPKIHVWTALNTQVLTHVRTQNSRVQRDMALECVPHVTPTYAGKHTQAHSCTHAYVLPLSRVHTHMHGAHTQSLCPCAHPWEPTQTRPSPCVCREGRDLCVPRACVCARLHDHAPYSAVSHSRGLSPGPVMSHEGCAQGKGTPNPAERCQALELGSREPPVAAAPGSSPAPAPAQEWGQQHHLLSAPGTALQRAHSWPSTGFLEGPGAWSRFCE